MGGSAYFRAMFEHPKYLESQSAELCLPPDSVEEQLLEPIVQYFYTGCVTINTENVESMIYSAALFLLEDLTQVSRDRSIDRSVQYLFRADKERSQMEFKNIPRVFIIMTVYYCFKISNTKSSHSILDHMQKS